MPEERKVTTADIDAVVGWTIIRAARHSGRILTAALRPHGLTPVEFGILAQLAAAHGELTQAEVARAAEIRPQSAAPVIEDLSSRDLLRREGPRGRGRSGRLVLTEEGESLLARVFPDVTATNEAFLSEATSESTNSALLTFLARIQTTDAM